MTQNKKEVRGKSGNVANTQWRKSVQQIQDELRDVEYEDIKCGLGSCAPSYVQFLARKETYLMLYSLVGVVLGMFFTYMVAVLSTIEKRFNLNSKQTGFMLAGNDVSQVLLSIIVSYYGNYGNRPRWMGLGVVCAAVSCFIAATPHLFYGAGTDADNTAFANSLTAPLINSSNSGIQLCPNTALEMCGADKVDDSGQTYNIPVIVFFISQFFLGVSVSSFHSIGIVYLDDNLDKREMPIYYGLSMMVRVLGPVMGFFLGSQCLAVWIDPSQHPDISMRDPRWLGAWWLGFLILGALLSLTGSVLFFFPKQLPSGLANQVEKLRSSADKKPESKELLSLEYYISLTKEKKKDDKPSLKKLPIAMRRLLTNKIWLGNSFNSTLFLLAYAGYWSFKPKYLETQFHKSASEANLFTGVASLIASTLGLMLGGIVVHWKKPRARVVTAYNIFTTAVSATVMFSLIFVGCPQIEVQGTDVTCSGTCDCSNEFMPVCSTDTGVTYYSACIAGCTKTVKNGSETIFTNCSCISPTDPVVFSESMENLVSSPHYNTTYPLGGTAHNGYCPQDCNSLTIYIVLNTISKLIGASGRVGGTLVYLRSVEEQDKALALGTLTVLLSLLAFIPGPIIMGGIVDSACRIWDTNCGERGNCWLYDSDHFRILMHCFTGSMLLISILGDIVVWKYSKNLKLYEDNHDDIELQPTTSNIEKETLSITT